MSQQEFQIEGNFPTGAARALGRVLIPVLISRRFCHISIVPYVDNGFTAEFNILPFRHLTRHVLPKAAQKNKRS